MEALNCARETYRKVEKVPAPEREPIQLTLGRPRFSLHTFFGRVACGLEALFAGESVGARECSYAI